MLSHNKSINHIENEGKKIVLHCMLCDGGQQYLKGVLTFTLSLIKAYICSWAHRYKYKKPVQINDRCRCCPWLFTCNCTLAGYIGLEKDERPCTQTVCSDSFHHTALFCCVNEAFWLLQTFSFQTEFFSFMHVHVLLRYWFMICENAGTSGNQSEPYIHDSAIAHI